MSRSPVRPLLRDHDLCCVWTAGLVSATGSLAMFVALPVTVFQSTGSAWTTALTALAGTVPAVVVGQIAGVLADRIDRRQLLVSANLAMAALTGVFLVLPNGLWWSFALVSLAVGVAAQFAAPAEHALIGDLVPPVRLGEGSSLNALNGNLARLIGPLLGGLVAASSGFRAVALVDLVTFLVAAALVARVRRRPGPRVARTPGDRTSWRSDWRQGGRAIRRHPALRLVVLVVTLTSFGEGAVSALLAPWAGQLLGSGAGLIGWLLTAQAVGGIAGAWWAVRQAAHRPPAIAIGWSALVAGSLCVIAFGYPLIDRTPWPAVVLTGAAGFGFAVFAAGQAHALQTYAVPALRGRVYAVAAGLFGLAQLAGILLAGAAARRFGAIMIVIDPVCYLIAGLVTLSGWKRIRRARSAAPGVRADGSAADANGGPSPAP